MRADIIIPVYNAFDYTRKCIESVLRFTNLSAEGFRLIVIDDGSTDERFAPFFASLQGTEGVVLLKNENNRGFVGTVNRGMQYSESDVVLLNSDTEVTEDWLQKLIACASSSPRIATVTPFSNNGTICSLPEFCRDNELTAQTNADSFARLVQQTSARIYPPLPTAVGFCMYVTRRALDAVGYFDEKTFYKGYGEENDFSYRAVNAGFINVLCDDTFILHKGTMSFQDEQRDEYMLRNTAYLEELYPRQRRETLEFIRYNPLRPLQQAVKLRLAAQNGLRNVLYLLHMPVPYREGDSQAGGTQKHVLELARELNGRCNSFILWPEAERGLCLLGLCGEETFELFYDAKDVPGETNEEKFRSVLQNILYAMDIDIAHVQHTMGLSDSVFEMLKKEGVPIVFTAHDFYMACPYVNMMHPGVYCGARFERCAICAGEQDRPLVEGRLQRSARALSFCDAVVAPDASVAEIYHLAFPDVPVRVVEHGIDPTLYEKPPEEQNEEQEKFDVAYIGTVNDIKGGEVLKDVLQQATGDSSLRFHVFGGVEDKHIGASLNGAVLHGPYQSRELLRLLKENHIRLALLFSRWPETYNYVMTECFLAGVPVLASDIGALGTRVRATGCGWLVPFHAGPQEILDTIRRIRDDRAGYAEKQAALKEYRPMTLAKMAQTYDELYASLVKQEKQSHKVFDPLLLHQAFVKGEQGTDTLGAAYAGGLSKVRSTARRVLPAPLADFFINGHYPFKRQIKACSVKAAALLRTLTHR